ncbi:hypothetical protein LAD97_003951 [Escherichia coli]|nr:hypothetical protein [Escherichia coli]
MDYPKVLAMNMFSSWLVLVILNTILLFRASKSFFSILTSKGYSRRHKAGGEFGRA